MTQDIGTAKLRFQDYPINKMIYVVGNEQNYHFQVLSILLDKLGFEWGKGLVHFSYGMVELPEGKMKSREGTVVDPRRSRQYCPYCWFGCFEIFYPEGGRT